MTRPSVLTGDVEAVGHKGLHAAAKNIIQQASLAPEINNCHIRAHPMAILTALVPHFRCPYDDFALSTPMTCPGGCRGCYLWLPANELHLYSHTARDFAHGAEQGQLSSGGLNCFIGCPATLFFKRASVCMGSGARCRKVKIICFRAGVILLLLGFFNLDYHVRAFKYSLAVGKSLRRRQHTLFRTAAKPRRLLNVHMAGLTRASAPAGVKPIRFS